MVSTSILVNPKKTIEQASSYVRNLLEEKLPIYIQYHDWDHTHSVYKTAIKLGQAMDCSDQEIECLALAALFHDTGFVEQHEDHESASIRIAEQYLQSVAYPKEYRETVVQLIKATRLDYEPKTLLEEIIVDADLSHLGKKKYLTKVEKLLDEQNYLNEEKILPAEWNKTNIAFLRDHDFYTEAAISFYEKRKNKNLLKLKKQRRQIRLNNSISENKAARMIFKTALRNHIDLTNIADQKANIMLTINAIILTLGMPLFSTFLMDRPTLKIPAILFLITCALSMILATFATRPVNTDGKTKIQSLFSGKTNLFFFGNFYKMKLTDYQSAINKIMGDPETLDKNIMNDLYYLGNALGKKFNMLRLCYTFFAIGLIITFLSFVISYVIYG